MIIGLQAALSFQRPPVSGHSSAGLQRPTVPDSWNSASWVVKSRAYWTMLFKASVLSRLHQWRRSSNSSIPSRRSSSPTSEYPAPSDPPRRDTFDAMGNPPSGQTEDRPSDNDQPGNSIPEGAHSEKKVKRQTPSNGKMEYVSAFHLDIEALKEWLDHRFNGEYGLPDNGNVRKITWYAQRHEHPADHNFLGARRFGWRAGGSEGAPLHHHCAGEVHKREF